MEVEKKEMCQNEFIKRLMERKDNIFLKKIKLMKQMQKLEDDIEVINDSLWNMCEHVWIRDMSCSDDDLSKKYCKHCKLRSCYR